MNRLNVFQLKHNILLKSIFYLVVILSFSYFASFVFPLLYNYTNCCYWLLKMGLPALLFTLFLSILLLYLLYKLDSNSFNKKSISQGLRLGKFKISDAFKAIGILFLVWVAELVLNFGLGRIGLSLIDKGNIVEKALVNSKPDDYVIYLFIIGFLVGSIAEELFWRGYLLPLQEEELGHKTWWLNGLLWALSHSFTQNPIRILFSALSFSYISYKYKNIWYTTIFHLFINTLVIIKTMKALNI